ncbi:unnamed protein product [Diamesa serratosioi]
MDSRKRKSDNSDTNDEFYYRDPLLNISEDLYEMVFQHFCCQTIKNVSILNRNWYAATSISKACMKRIRLQIDFSGPPLKHDLPLYQNSVRKFQNINIFCPNGFNLTQECLKIIKCHAKTVVHLEVWGMNDDIKEVEQILLPRMESLQFVDTEGNAACSMLLKASTKLKVLNLLTSQYHPSIIDCLLANKNIHELHLSREIVHGLFLNGVPPFEFKLNKLIVKAHIKEGYNDVKFVKFLLTQQDLKIVNFYGVSVEVLLTIMNEITYIREIEFRSTPVRDFRPAIRCYPNSNIRVLKFDACFDSFYILKIILDASPELEQLYLVTVPVELLNYIVITNLKLRRIFYKIDFDDVTQDAYVHLKLSNYFLNRDIIFIKN